MTRAEYKMTTEPLLELRGVAKYYRPGGLLARRKERDVLQCVNLLVEPGQCLGIVGVSGAGKSTLARIALGIEQPDMGQALFLGQDMAQGLGKHRQLLQAVFQDAASSLNPRRTVGQSLSEPLRNFDLTPETRLAEHVGELLKQVGLSPKDANKYPHQMSGGEQQRVCIARALAPCPKLIVLDEAVSSLDMLIQAQILDLLDSLRATSQTAFLFVTHDVRIISGFCDRIAVLAQGTLAEVDSDNLAMDTPHEETYRRLCAAVLPAIPQATQKGHPQQKWQEYDQFESVKNAIIPNRLIVGK